MNGVLRYGGSASSPVMPVGANFVGAGMNMLSLGCTPIELLSNDGNDVVIGTATGFFWKRNAQPFLVTNWHVVSGRNSFTEELNPKGFIPRKLRFYGFSVATSSGVVTFKRVRWELRWDENMVELLSKPPQYAGQSIDIWGTPIPPEAVFGKEPTRTGFKGAEEATCFLSDHDGQRIVTNVGDDCFVLGYPLKNYDGLMPPIWKRGSIASETVIGVDGRPIFLVDAATTEGMSGSPIIRKAITITADNKDIGAIQEFSTYELVGVYAGRLESSDLAVVGLGYGWHRTMIDVALDQYNFPPPTAEMNSSPTL